MTRPDVPTSPAELRVLTWNVFHGRDFPPDPELFTARSRLLRVTEHNATHVQFNRPLRLEFTELLAAARWDICLLQEAPPSWDRTLAHGCGAGAARALTSRNQLGPLRAVAARLNPDLIGANEGGSNLILYRPPWRPLGPGRSLLLNPRPERGTAERRTMAFVRLRAGAAVLCAGNLHCSTRPRAQAEREVVRAADAADAWAAGAPLVLGGDFNLRPSSSRAFELLAARHGLAPATGPDAIDHLLSRGLEVVRPPHAWEPGKREQVVRGRWGERLLRLSDHAPVEAVLRLPSTGVR